MDLPSLGIFSTPVVLSDINLDQNDYLKVELKFWELKLSDRRRLIDFVFGQPNRWQTESISEIKSF